MWFLMRISMRPNRISMEKRGANMCGANNSLVFHAVQIALFRLVGCLLVSLSLFSSCFFLSSLLYCHRCCKRERWITITTIHRRIIRAFRVLCMVVQHDIIILKHLMPFVRSIDNDYFNDHIQLVHLVSLLIYFLFFIFYF